MRRWRRPGPPWSATRFWGTQSATSIEPTDGASRPGRWPRGWRKLPGNSSAVFDADFLPTPDFLQRTIHCFTDPGVGMVQTRWTFLNREYSLLTRVQAILLDGHFVAGARRALRLRLLLQFQRHGGHLAARGHRAGGGWQHDTLTEDTDLSYRAQLCGWRFLYLPDVECPSELPVEMTAFKTQQARWAKGLIQTARKLMPRIWAAPIPLRQKVEAWFHLTANISFPLMAVLAVLLLPAMIVALLPGLVPDALY